MSDKDLDFEKLLAAKPNKAMTKDIILGEFMELTMKLLREQKTLWADMPQDLQESKIDQIREDAEASIAHMVSLVASTKHAVVIGRLLNVQFKSTTIRTVMEFSSADEHRHRLADFTTRQAVLVLVDPDEYLAGGEHSHEATPDQTPLNGFD